MLALTLRKRDRKIKQYEKAFDLIRTLAEDACRDACAADSTDRWEWIRNPHLRNAAEIALVIAEIADDPSAF